MFLIYSYGRLHFHVFPPKMINRSHLDFGSKFIKISGALSHFFQHPVLMRSKVMRAQTSPIPSFTLTDNITYKSDTLEHRSSQAGRGRSHILMGNCFQCRKNQVRGHRCRSLHQHRRRQCQCSMSPWSWAYTSCSMNLSPETDQRAITSSKHDCKGQKCHFSFNMGALSKETLNLV